MASGSNGGKPQFCPFVKKRSGGAPTETPVAKCPA